MTQLPGNQHITYQLQYRKCGKASCSTCRDRQGHGPYWYAYWREGARLRSGYIGKVHPDSEFSSGAVETAGTSLPPLPPSPVTVEETVPAPVMV